MGWIKNLKICSDQIDVMNAYLKITSVQINTEFNTPTASATVLAYTSREAAEQNKPPLPWQYADSFIPEFGNGLPDIKAQVYNAFSQKDMFMDAIPVFEPGQI